MKKIYLDTNVILDFLLGRDGCNDTKILLQLSSSKAIRLYCSILTIADAFYVLRKQFGKELALRQIDILSSRLNVLPMGDMTLYSVLNDCGPDFEDSLQLECAISSDCDILLTHNLKHFKDSGILTCTPQEFLARCE